MIILIERNVSYASLVKGGRDNFFPLTMTHRCIYESIKCRVFFSFLILSHHVVIHVFCCPTMSFSTIVDNVLKKYFLGFLRKVLEYFLSFLTVQIPMCCYFVGTLGKKNELREKQGRIRAKLINEEDPSSPYRAVEVLDKLQTQPEGRVNTLAVIPDLCLQRHADKQTMGVREILNVEEEKQANGRVFKKVLFRRVFE